MKKSLTHIVFIAISISTSLAFGEPLDLKKDLFGSSPSLFVTDSRGPKWLPLMEEKLYEIIDETIDHRYFEDGLNHGVDFKSCVEPKVQALMGKIHEDDFDVSDALFEGEMTFDNLVAVKSLKSKSKKSVAYGITPVAIYNVEVSIYLKDRGSETVFVNCSVSLENRYFFENKKPKSVEDVVFLGNEEDLSLPPVQLDLDL